MKPFGITSLLAAGAATVIAAPALAATAASLTGFNVMFGTNGVAGAGWLTAVYNGAHPSSTKAKSQGYFFVANPTAYNPAIFTLDEETSELTLRSNQHDGTNNLGNKLVVRAFKNGPNDSSDVFTWNATTAADANAAKAAGHTVKPITCSFGGGNALDCEVKMGGILYQEVGTDSINHIALATPNSHTTQIFKLTYTKTSFKYPAQLESADEAVLS